MIGKRLSAIYYPVNGLGVGSLVKDHAECKFPWSSVTWEQAATAHFSHADSLGTSVCSFWTSSFHTYQLLPSRHGALFSSHFPVWPPVGFTLASLGFNAYGFSLVMPGNCAHARPLQPNSFPYETLWIQRLNQGFTWPVNLYRKIQPLIFPGLKSTSNTISHNFLPHFLFGSSLLKMPKQWFVSCISCKPLFWIQLDPKLYFV